MSNETSKMTPGPWEHGEFWYPKDGGYGQCEIAQVGEVSILANVILPARTRTAHGQGEANAKAIAALPDLIEALRVSLVAMEEMSDDYCASHKMDCAIESARAALKKAGVL